MPTCEPDRPREGGPNRPNGIYVIRFRNTPNGPQQKDFIRGYGFQGGGGSRFNFDAPGYGAAFKKAVLTPAAERHLSWRLRRNAGARSTTSSRSIRPGPWMRSAFPTLKIHMAFGDNERAMMKDMAVTAAEMLEAAGAVGVGSYVQPNPVPGWGIHEVGIARMGDDPKTSVLTQFCRTHDVENLFVMDGSCLCLDRLPESDVDDHGADGPRQRSSPGGDAEGPGLTDIW